MKNLLLLLFLLFSPAVFYAQKSLTGLWTGALTNDSVTVRQDQSFEMVLSQYKQKVTGYSRSTFIVNDSLYYIVKSVKGTVDGNICEITDDDIISHNFPVKPDKGVKVTITFKMNPWDSAWYLTGDWTTNKVKKRYYSISGKADLKDEKDLSKSKIIPHLEELNLTNDIAFYKEAKEREQQAIVQQKKTSLPVITAKVETLAQKENNISIKDKGESIKQEEIKEIVINDKPIEEKKTTTNSVKEESGVAAITKCEEKKPIITQSLKSKPEVVSNKPVEEKKSTETRTVPPPTAKSDAIVSSKPAETKPATIVTTDKKQEEKKEVVAAKPVEEKKQIVSAEKKPVTVEAKQIIDRPTAMQVAAVKVNERATVSSQTVTFKSDSLQLALYDNGEVDGDTVSVLLNGEIILAKQGLKTSAIRKTIYIEPGNNEFTIVLYAENLGSFPPNTGLLMIYDGEDRYQVRFSADLQQNAAVIFKRKK